MGSTAALIARATGHADAPSPVADVGREIVLGPIEAPLRALGMLGAGLDAMTRCEQQISALLPAPPIPLPAMPALVALGGFVLGLPHAHMHPPNLVPPSPVPIPFPSFGQMFQIPFLSGASTVQIGGIPAARCGDMGIAMGCGGLFPMFEVFTGSSSVWIEGARAARTGDVSKHCIFSAPLPTDPPLGPMLGAIVANPGTVQIGGMPLPSLTNLAIAGASRLVFAVGAMARRAATATTYVDHLLSSGALRVEGSAEYVAAIRRDLEAMARTASGRSVLGRIEAAAARTGNSVTIRTLQDVIERRRPDGSVIRSHLEHNAFAGPHSSAAAQLDQNGVRGAGSSVTVRHTPSRWGPNGPSCTWTVFENGQPVRQSVSRPPPGTTSDAMLHHEMTHAANFMDGTGAQSLPIDDPDFAQRWSNAEEYVTVHSENGYRRETQGLFGAPQRRGYGDLP